MATRAVSTVVCVRAWDTSANTPKTGDSANITLKWIKDGTSSTTTNACSEVDSTNAPGVYKVTLTSTETDCTFGALAGKSSTANISIFGPEIGFEYVPTSAATFGAFIGNATAALAVDASGRVDIGKLLGTAWLTPGTAGTPDVNVKLWNALATVALPVVPTVAGRSLDISAGGEAGVDWANVGTPGSTVNLAATTVNLCNTITTYTGNTVQTGDAFARIGAAGAGLTAVGLTGTQTFNNTGTWTGNIVGTLSTLTTYTGNTPQTGDSFARIGAAGAGLTSVALTSAYDFAKGTVAVTESYNTDGAAPTPVQALMGIMQILMESSIAGTAWTVKKLDGSTTAFGLTINDATTPTSVSRTS